MKKLKKIRKTYLIGGVACIVILMSSTAFALAKGENNKSEVIIDNITNEIKAEENEIINKIKDGEEKLTKNNYDEAMESFKDAISKEVTNKDTYIKIKDIYMGLNRKDDAYHIVRLAIANNIEKEEMTKIGEEIRKEFEVSTLTLKQSNRLKISLPKTVTMNINNQPKEVEVTWEPVTDTKVGSYVVKGKSIDYERDVELNLILFDKITKDEAMQIVKNKFGDKNNKYIYNRDVKYKKQSYYGFEHSSNTNGVWSANDYLIMVNEVSGDILYYLSDGNILNLDKKIIGTKDEMTKEEASEEIKKQFGNEIECSYFKDIKFKKNNYYAFEWEVKYENGDLSSDSLIIVDKVVGTILYCYPDGRVVDLSKNEVGFLE
ncbi:MAG: Ig-like domain-containing protein [Clostridium sp.]